MSRFQLSGLSHELFDSLFDRSDAQLRLIDVVRTVATTDSAFPCRVSLQDAAVGEELVLLSYEHHSTASPYRSSGPIFVRRHARQVVLAAGVVPPYVSQRQMSLRAYDSADMMTDAIVCEGTVVAEHLDTMFARSDVSYVHLHNARRGCFSCLAQRAE